MIEDLCKGVLGQERLAIAKAITLIESHHPDHQVQARALLDSLLPHTGRSLRIGVSGNPGAGKSTFIEKLGTTVIEYGHRIAVLAIDPSSSISGGSILADKTRMEQLSVHPSAFIRPSPSRGSLGGVARKTREAMLVCEAAGFDVLVVETVGVGQSEIAVAGMTDVFVLLQLPNAGDELQAMKKGVLEMADLVVVNKADLDQIAADRAATQLSNVLHLLRPAGKAWAVEVLTVSALTGHGVAYLWSRILACRDALHSTGEWQGQRREQATSWMWQLVEEGLRERLRRTPALQSEVEAIATEVASGKVSASAAATRVLGLLDH